MAATIVRSFHVATEWPDGHEAEPYGFVASEIEAAANQVAAGRQIVAMSTVNVGREFRPQVIVTLVLQTG
jgi:hypothetical protein